MPLNATYRNIAQGSPRKAQSLFSFASARGRKSWDAQTLAFSLLAGAVAAVAVRRRSHRHHPRCCPMSTPLWPATAQL